VGALSLDYQGERFRASLDVVEQYQWIDLPPRPFLANDPSTLLHAEYDVNDNLTVFADAGGTKSDVSRYSDQTPTILNSAETPQPRCETGNSRSTGRPPTPAHGFAFTPDRSST
jgi:hypothetical protein